jgi:hypothetical protein
MGRKIKGSFGTKTEKINIRVDAALRKRIEDFAMRGPLEGEELQVVIRMLIRAGLAVEERFKEVRGEVEHEIEKRGANLRKEGRTSAAAKQQD